MKLLKFTVALFILAQSCASNPETVLCEGNGVWNLKFSTNKIEGSFTFIKTNNGVNCIETLGNSFNGFNSYGECVFKNNNLIIYSKDHKSILRDLKVVVIDNKNVELINNNNNIKNNFKLLLNKY